jgi:intracellular sulfur oxidation DsrE/DsrF family protein
MNDRRKPSDTAVDSFVDGELSGRERLELHQAAAENPDLAARICEARKLKSLLRDAYAEPPQPPSRSRARGREEQRWRMPAAAAGLALALGAGIGWWANERLAPGPGWATVADARSAEIGDALGAVERVILHLGSADPQRTQAALDQIERLVADAGRESRPLQVEIIANGGGLDLVRSDGAPQAQRIIGLMREHGNVSVLACRKALERLSYVKGVEAELLDGVLIAPSALDQILLRMRQGWLYIRV